MSGPPSGRNPFVVRASIRTEITVHDDQWVELRSQSLRSQGIDSDDPRLSANGGDYDEVAIPS